MRQLWFLAAVLAGFCVAGCQRSAETYLKRGKALMGSHKYAEAALNFRVATQRNPRLGEAYYELALAELGMQNAAAGYQDLLRAAELLPARADIKIRLGEMSLAAFVRDKNRPKVMHDRASGLADEVIAVAPKLPDGYRLKAYLAAADGKFQQAEDLFRKANGLSPMQPSTIFGLVEILFRDNQAAEAEKLALQLIDQNKTFTPIYDLLYGQYMAAGRTADAESILLKKTVNNPSDAGSVLQLAAFYTVNGKPDLVNSALRQLLDHPKTFPQAHVLVGDFYGRMQRWPEALQQYNEGAKANPKDKIIYLKRTAEVWLAQGKGEQASQVVEEILKQDPSDEAAKAVKASLLLTSGQPEKISSAVTQFRQLVKDNPDNPVWRYNLGRALAASGDVTAARTSFEDAIKRRPDFLQPRMALADLNMNTGNYTEALRYADEMIATNKNIPAGHRARAVSLLNLGRYAEARQELGLIEKAIPDEAELQFANIEIKEKNFRAAEARLLKLLEKRPGNPRIISGLVLIYVSANQLGKAESFLDDEIRKGPNSDLAQRLRADIEVRSGKYDQAIEHYKQVLTGDSSSPQLYAALGNAYRLKGDEPNAITNLEKAASLAPRDPSPVTLIAQAQTDAGQKAAAVQSFRRALERSPDSVALMNNLAYLMADSGGNLDEALALIQKALQKAPGQPNLIDTLGWVYLKKNWNGSALDVLGGLAQKYPDNPTFRYHFGMALLQKGDKATARTEFRAGLSKKPSSEVRQSIETALTATQ